MFADGELPVQSRPLSSGNPGPAPLPPRPIADAEATFGGYSIIQADDLEAAVALMEGHPHFMSGEDATIQIHETLDIPGM